MVHRRLMTTKQELCGLCAILRDLNVVKVNQEVMLSMPLLYARVRASRSIWPLIPRSRLLTAVGVYLHNISWRSLKMARREVIGCAGCEEYYMTSCNHNLLLQYGLGGYCGCCCYIIRSSKSYGDGNFSGQWRLDTLYGNLSNVREGFFLVGTKIYSHSYP